MRTLQLERRILNVRALPKPIPFQMGLQVPYCVCTQATAQSDIRADAPSSGTDFPCAGSAKGVPDYRRASDAGPCAYVYRDSPQAPGSLRDRVSEREECDRDCPPVWQGAE